VVRNIADIVSKGGNYLINVGPTADGELPKEDVAILREVGQWTHANAEAIYGAGPTPFGEELGYEDPTQLDKEGKAKWIDRDEWRCTTKPGKLYFALLTWPGATFTLPVFENKVTNAYLLADPQRTPLKVTGGKVTLPASVPSGLAPVLCVEIEGEVKAEAPKAKLDPKKETES
jgi:alpha-L-fucosidase